MTKKKREKHLANEKNSLKETTFLQTRWKNQKITKNFFILEHFFPIKKRKREERRKQQHTHSQHRTHKTNKTNKTHKKAMSGRKNIEGEYHEEEYIDITVTEPLTLRDGEKEYTTYKITTETTFPEYNQRLFSVRRRYSQFVTLHAILKKKLNANPKNIKFGALPSLPGDTRAALNPSSSRSAVLRSRSGSTSWPTTLSSASSRPSTPSSRTTSGPRRARNK